MVVIARFQTSLKPIGLIGNVPIVDGSFFIFPIILELAFVVVIVFVSGKVLLEFIRL